MIWFRGTGAGACLALSAWAARCDGPGATAAPTPARAPSTPPVAVAPASPQPAAMRPLDASAHLYTSTQSQLGEPETRVIRDQAGWDAAWRALHAGLAAGAPPAVDFARHMVVLVTLGQRSSGGHAVRVDGVRDAPNGALEVHVTRTAPGPDCMTASVMSAPVDVVRLPRAAGSVRLVARDVIEPCG